MNALNNRIPPPVVFAATAILMWLIGHFAPRYHMSPTLRGVLVVLGLAVALRFLPSAVMAFRRHNTTPNPVQIHKASSLITDGAFALSRNPMYASLVALLFAWAGYLASPWTLIGPILLELYLLRFQIFPEERAMMAKFGSSYVEYAKQVRRWI